MSDFVSHRPYYYQTGQSRQNQQTPILPKFGRGNGVGSILDVLNWVGNEQGRLVDIDKAEREVLTSQLSTTISASLLKTGHKGYLLKVTRFRHSDNGSVHSRIDGPTPIGSGNNPEDALARSLVQNKRGVITSLPNGYEYDQSRSFTVWVQPNQNGDLAVTALPYPVQLHRRAQHLIIDGLVAVDDFDQVLENRSLSYSRALTKLRRIQLAERTDIALASLSRTRDGLASSLSAANKLLKRAKAAKRDAEAFGQIKAILGAAGYAVKNFSSKPSSEASPEVQQKTVQNIYIEYREIEIKLQEQIKSIDPSIDLPEITPSPLS
ncbi:MAG: hypothetical protein AAF636_08520 [Pseudomonadota bacterium]